MVPKREINIDHLSKIKQLKSARHPYIQMGDLYFFHNNNKIKLKLHITPLKRRLKQITHSTWDVEKILDHSGLNFTYIRHIILLDKKLHHYFSQVFFDSSGSRWLVPSLETEISLVPDSSWDRAASSGVFFSSLFKRLDFFSSNGDSLIEESVKLCTRCRQTWTASCTRTKNHSLPIRSTTPDFVSVSRTPRFGLETAIWNIQGNDLINESISMAMIYANLVYLDVTWSVFMVQLF